MKLVSLLALFIGAAVGLYLPDVDQVFPFLLHRSLLTHGVLLPLGMLWLTRASRSEWQRFALMGLCTALAVHLSFDLFPSLWRGYALISVPFIGQLSGTLSILWIAGNIVAALYLALTLMQSKTELTIVFALSAGAFLLAAPGERVFWSALLMLLLGWFAACVCRTRLSTGRISRDACGHAGYSGLVSSSQTRTDAFTTFHKRIQMSLTLFISPSQVYPPCVWQSRCITLSLFILLRAHIAHVAQELTAPHGQVAVSMHVRSFVRGLPVLFHVSLPARVAARCGTPLHPDRAFLSVACP